MVRALELGARQHNEFAQSHAHTELPECGAWVMTWRLSGNWPGNSGLHGEVRQLEVTAGGGRTLGKQPAVHRGRRMGCSREHESDMFIHLHVCQKYLVNILSTVPWYFLSAPGSCACLVAYVKTMSIVCEQAESKWSHRWSIATLFSTSNLRPHTI